MTAKNIPRRQAIPVLYTRGTHYDVGFDMGRTFASIIKNFLLLSTPLNESYLPLYKKDEGRKVYNETLESVKQSFPQYIRELEGIADGAQVEFHKLFLLHMDEITAICANGTEAVAPVGCSTIIVNNEKSRILAHTEDALTATLNHYYFVVAHIINDTPQGKHKVKEEHFMSLCYAGHLPGYTMNYNHHGLVFTINTLAASDLKSGKTPRHFITRALLSAENYDQALNILKDEGVGAGDGCSINLSFINDESGKFYNIEMAPVPEDGTESRLDIKEVCTGEHNCHANRYERLCTKEANPWLLESSKSRMNTFDGYQPPNCKDDVVQMLSDCSGGDYCVFNENNSLDELVKTIAVGVFDLNEKTVALYSDNPGKTKPHCVLPLILKQ
ncbi:beta-alanyl-dopamine/carcinine hydrolase [Anastrepha obliqua]|uniref:beta-alanyl-dopamine/carcinine hydrolase n=1 Tax=Anastrepha obliqua TaxID=95512 RepID=UPI00240A3293|nr:beta-alanyl-dopamine/carcinine hydrolase [Anastrepha obliqua]